MQEVQGESTKSVTALFGSLAEYEPTLIAQRNLQGTTKAKNLALVAPSKERLDDDDEHDEEIDDEEMTMMVRRFKKFFKRKRKILERRFQLQKGYLKRKGTCLL